MVQAVARRASFLMAAASFGFAQAPAGKPAFEVASVKVNTANSPSDMRGPRLSGEWVVMHNTPLYSMIFYAYHLNGNVGFGRRRPGSRWLIVIAPSFVLSAVDRNFLLGSTKDCPSLLFWIYSAKPKMERILRFAALLAVGASLANAQWLDYPSPHVPRLKNGKVNLAAPPPRAAGGHPDLSGIWATADGKYLNNLGVDGADLSMLPWAAKIYAERQANHAATLPSLHCIPHSITDFDALVVPKKLIQTRDELVILFEAYHSYRQVFTDGRPLPKDPEPAWFGYSVGHWEGDTLVVESSGINEQTWLDDGGHPHSDALRVTERFHRRDFGHMTVEVTITDPKAYAKPWKVTLPWSLLPDGDLLDWVCLNEKDAQHTIVK